MVISYESLFGAAVAEARRRNLPVFDESPPVNREVDVNGLKLHFLDWGGNARTPMLLIHGAMVTAHVWDFFGLEMREHFRIYAVNLRGPGDNPAHFGREVRAFLASNGLLGLHQVE